MVFDIMQFKIFNIINWNKNHLDWILSLISCLDVV